jgi:1-acyl-sn-glycerol-3-phosphate acyltransferase
MTGQAKSWLRIPRTERTEAWVRRLVHCYFRTFYFIRFRGQEHLTHEGPAIYAANHVSYYDPLLIALGESRPMQFMAWDALFGHPQFGRLLLDWGVIPVDVDGSDPGGFKTCLKRLQEGNRVGIFPEGQRSRTGELMPLKEGVARLAMKAGVPIVPVVIRGAYKAWPRGEFAPRPFFPIEVEFFPPLFPRAAAAGKERREEAGRITEELGAILNRGTEEPGGNGAGQ